MARIIWTGAISFGLVSIPVGLYSATEDHAIGFHQFQRGTADRIRYQRVNARTGKEVDYADIVKGRDIGGGEFVIVEPEELEAIAPGRSRSIDITSFVDLAEIAPVYFQKTYWIAPDGDQYLRPYGLLLEAVAQSNRAGIATFVMRGKEYLAAIRAAEGVLALETLLFADEVRNPDDALDALPQRSPSRGKELEQLIETKRRGHEIVTEAEPREPTEMSDLLEALQRSVDSARSGGRRDSAGPTTSRICPTPAMPTSPKWPATSTSPAARA